jgi:hypothetical protein
MSATRRNIWQATDEQRTPIDAAAVAEQTRVARVEAASNPAATVIAAKAAAPAAAIRAQCKAAG